MREPAQKHREVKTPALTRSCDARFARFAQRFRDGFP